jgi:hypothetical protein
MIDLLILILLFYFIIVLGIWLVIILIDNHYNNYWMILGKSFLWPYRCYISLKWLLNKRKDDK